MQEYLKKSSCFFALIFLLFVIAVSLPGIFETGEFLKDHLDAAYWSSRADRQVVYLPPAEEIPPPPICKNAEEAVSAAQKIKAPVRPEIKREKGTAENKTFSPGIFDHGLFYKIREKISPFIVERSAIENAVIENFPLRYEFSEYNMAFKYLLGVKQPVDGEDLRLGPDRMLSNIPDTDDCEAACYYADLAGKLSSRYFVVIEPWKTDFSGTEGFEFEVERRKLKITENIAALKEHDAETVDLRDLFKSKNMMLSDIFYRGDHHWKTTAALLAAEHLADYMNRNCHTDYDLRYLRKDAFLQEIYRKIFIGSSAKKAGLAYTGEMEDFVVFTPLYQTKFEVDLIDRDLSMRHIFGDFRKLNDYVNFYRDPYQSNPYAFFTAGDKPFIKIKNQYCRKTPKIAILKNSFANAVIPYLALQTSEMLVFDERYMTMEKITEKLIEERPDIIIYLNSKFDAYCKENNNNF